MFRDFAEAYHWPPDVVGALSPKQVFAYCGPPREPRKGGRKIVKCKTRAEADALVADLRSR